MLKSSLRGSRCRQCRRGSTGRVPVPVGEGGNAAKQAPANARDEQAMRADGADQAGAHLGAFDDGDRLGELGSPAPSQKRNPTRHGPHDGGIQWQWPQGVVASSGVERNHSCRGARQRVLNEHIRCSRDINSAHARAILESLCNTDPTPSELRVEERG